MQAEIAAATWVFYFYSQPDTFRDRDVIHFIDMTARGHSLHSFSVTPIS